MTPIDPNRHQQTPIYAFKEKDLTWNAEKKLVGISIRIEVDVSYVLLMKSGEQYPCLRLSGWYKKEKGKEV